MSFQNYVVNFLYVSIQDDCNGNYIIIIRERSTPSETEIVIDGIGNTTDYTVATVDGKNFSFEQSNYRYCPDGSTGSYSIVGSGTLNKDELDITYTYSACGATESCNATGERRD